LPLHRQLHQIGNVWRQVLIQGRPKNLWIIGEERNIEDFLDELLYFDRVSNGFQN
jgi:hypothetical protein